MALSYVPQIAGRIVSFWQRRRVDVPTAVDYTQADVGDVFITATATLVECPGCGLPGVVECDGQLVVHKRHQGGAITDACAIQPDGEAAIRIWDEDGELAYAGDFIKHPGEVN